MSEGSEDRNATYGWHVDKRVNVSHMVATAAVAAALFGWGSAITQRITVLEERSMALKEADEARRREVASQTSLLRDDMRTLRGDLGSVNSKIDRLIEALSRENRARQ